MIYKYWEYEIMEIFIYFKIEYFEWIVEIIGKGIINLK